MEITTPTEATSHQPGDLCEHCGSPLNNPGAVEQLLARLGLNDQMIEKLKKTLEDSDIDEYVSTAREYLKNGGDKAKAFTKDNPGKVAAGVAVLAVGAGLIINAMSKKD